MNCNALADCLLASVDNNRKQVKVSAIKELLRYGKNNSLSLSKAIQYSF